MQKIIHIDLDSYYAAVEIRDHPELKGIPLAIGGSQYGRGVLSTCSYEARKFGVRSAMPTAHALRLCPELTVISGNMEKYKAVSQQIQVIFRRYTDLIEPLSLDEAYLDVTGSTLFHGSATLIAQDIRKSIENELHLTASAGVAPLKFVAKVASDINKPNGICVVTPDELQPFIDQLALGRISGVGKVTLQKLNNLGLYVGQDVKNYDRNQLFKQFGKFGQTLWQRCHGIDKRKVEVSRLRKSLGVERTFEKDIYTAEACLQQIKKLYPELLRRFSKVKADRRMVRQGIKLKFSDFQQTRVEHKQNKLSESFFEILLEEALMRRKGRGIRLVGLNIGFEDLEEESAQLSFEWGAQ